jgi:hypothetical protein
VRCGASLESKISAVKRIVPQNAAVHRKVMARLL